MRPQLRIRFCDFHRKLPYSEGYFRHLLSSAYELDEDSDPDFVLFSNYGRSHREFNAVRIFYSMENERPDFDECDYAITFDFLHTDQHLRLPYYIMQPGIEQLVARTQPVESGSCDEYDKRSNFCAFVHSNPFGRTRNRLLTRLSRYKQVKSGGRYRNNLGYQVDDKIEFMRTFRFGFAFENESYPGYTTEKLTDVFLAGAIPIYWGNNRVHEEFNQAAMLNRHDFESDEALVHRIIEIDKDRELWSAYHNQPCFQADRLPAKFAKSQVLKWFARVFENTTAPIASRAAHSGHHRHWTLPKLSRRVGKFARHSVKGIRLATGI